MSSAPAIARRMLGRERHALPAALALGRFEGRKLLKHPMVIVGALLSLAIPVAMTWVQVPVLNRYDAHSNEALLPLVAAALLASQLGTMRARRNRTTELFDSAPVSEGTELGAHLIAALHGAVLALGLVIVELAYMKVIGGAAAPRLPVVLIGPALVGLGGVLGTAVGRWAPRLFAGPATIAVLVAVCSALSTNTFEHNREWLSLWVPSEVVSGVASEMSMRPYGWRLFYIVALIIVAAGVAFAHLPRRRPLALALVAIGMVGAVVGGGREIRSAPRSEQAAVAASFIERLGRPRCEESQGIEYCPMAGYESWVENWRRPVAGVIAAAPAGSVPANLRVVQAPSQSEGWGDRANVVLMRQLRREEKKGFLSLESDIHPGLSWGRGSEGSDSELAVALAVASNVTRIDSHFRLSRADIEGISKGYRHRDGFRLGRRYETCTMAEQGRAIVALWLAAQATDGSRSSFASAVEATPFLAEPVDNDPSRYFEPHQWALNELAWATMGTAHVYWGTRESAYAAELLEADQAEARALVTANWDRLTDPRTTSDEAATLLGLEPLVPLAEAMKNWHYGHKHWAPEQLGVPRCQ